MPKNNYFDYYNDTAQQTLFQGLLDECINFFGLSTYYIPRISLSQNGVDFFFGDDMGKAFNDAFSMQMMVTNVDMFDGPGDLFTKFSLITNKSIRLLLGNTEFQTATNGNLGTRPREGDVIWLAPMQVLMEIKYVNKDKLFYAFGSKPFYGWELQCEEFRYNTEQINTGIEEIDSAADSVNIVYTATMNLTGGMLTYIAGEIVYQGTDLANATAQAIVTDWNVLSGTLDLKNIAGVFTPNVVVYGAQSSAQYRLDSIEIQDNINEVLENNVLIRTEANTYLDQSETDPLFGNPILTQSQE